ncbi:MAG TPA: HypC/HybG/HupF family hydrogenase formation chaperone [Acidimicrobiales bacterium]|nr:HypC/HybG/HupF family hydrogenase formation chaperone [Acidimicrobiales bacterium]
MCLSRLQRVVAGDGTAVWTVDPAGARRRVSLLALDGPRPVVGDWLVVHSGYALARADPEDAAEALAALTAADARQPGGDP